MDDLRLLLAMVEEKARLCQEAFMITNSVFLDLAQRSAVVSALRRPEMKGFRGLFYGGYADCERAVCIFLPEYIEAETDAELNQYFLDNPEDNPLSLVRLSVQGRKPAGQKSLGHRDYLGALMGLGLKRERIGDILVREDGADILILKEMETFLLNYFGKAGNRYLNGESLPMRELLVPERRTEQLRDTVASLRLDNVIASAFRISRTKAREAISSGLIFLNDVQVVKGDKPVGEGDKLVWRGKGKAYLREIGPLTRKDRINVTMERFL